MHATYRTVPRRLDGFQRPAHPRPAPVPPPRQVGSLARGLMPTSHTQGHRESAKCLLESESFLGPSGVCAPHTGRRASPRSPHRRAREEVGQSALRQEREASFPASSRRVVAVSSFSARTRATLLPSDKATARLCVSRPHIRTRKHTPWPASPSRGPELWCPAHRKLGLQKHLSPWHSECPMACGDDTWEGGRGAWRSPATWSRRGSAGARSPEDTQRWLCWGTRQLPPIQI